MAAFASGQSCSISQRLVELLEQAREPCSATPTASFGDRLDALEVEALERCAPGATLVMIRVAREAIEFAERIAIRSRRS